MSRTKSGTLIKQAARPRSDAGSAGYRPLRDGVAVPRIEPKPVAVDYRCSRCGRLDELNENPGDSAEDCPGCASPVEPVPVAPAKVDGLADFEASFGAGKEAWSTPEGQEFLRTMRGGLDSHGVKQEEAAPVEAPDPKRRMTQPGLFDALGVKV